MVRGTRHRRPIDSDVVFILMITRTLLLNPAGLRELTLAPTLGVGVAKVVNGWTLAMVVVSTLVNPH